MTAPDPWITNLERELSQLVQSAIAGPMDVLDRYRLLVLLARCAQLEAPPAPIEAILRAAIDADLARRQLPCLPHPHPILDGLDAALEETDEPAGPLADALLDVDDLVSALWMLGGTDDAGELAAEAEALVSGAPARVAPLSSWATNRLRSIDADHPVAALWRAVQVAPVDALDHGARLTPLDAAGVAAVLLRADGQSVIRGGLKLSDVPLLREAYSAAAAGQFASFEPFERDDLALYVDGERIVVEVRLDGRRSLPVAELVVCEAGVTWRHPVPRTRVEPDRAMYEFPSMHGLAKWFVLARATTRQSSTSAPEITLEWVDLGTRP